MTWTVDFTDGAAKNAAKLPNLYHGALLSLVRDIEEHGPVRGNMPNYSKLGQNRHHCHLKRRGKPTYVAVWEVSDKICKIVEVTYVGTREKAPY